MTIHCCCPDPNCQTRLHLDAASPGLWFTDQRGQQTLMYLDANAIVQLIAELRHLLLHLTSPPVEEGA